MASLATSRSDGNPGTITQQQQKDQGGKRIASPLDEYVCPTRPGMRLKPFTHGTAFQYHHHGKFAGRPERLRRQHGLVAARRMVYARPYRDAGGSEKPNL